MNYNPIKLLYCSIAIFCLASCTQPKGNSRYADSEEKLNGYLDRTFHKTIGKDSTKYLLISQYACGSCIGGILNAFKADARAVFIINQATKNKYFSEGSMKAALLVDSTDNINRLSLHNGGIGIIQTSNAGIDTIIYIKVDSLQEQVSAVR